MVPRGSPVTTLSRLTHAALLAADAASRALPVLLRAAPPSCARRPAVRALAATAARDRYRRRCGAARRNSYSVPALGIYLCLSLGNAYVARHRETRHHHAASAALPHRPVTAHGHPPKLTPTLGGRPRRDTARARCTLQVSEEQSCSPSVAQPARVASLCTRPVASALPSRAPTPPRVHAQRRRPPFSALQVPRADRPTRPELPPFRVRHCEHTPVRYEASGGRDARARDRVGRRRKEVQP